MGVLAVAREVTTCSAIHRKAADTGKERHKLTWKVDWASPTHTRIRERLANLYQRPCMKRGRPLLLRLPGYGPSHTCTVPSSLAEAM
jgi:hypothetical protein